MRKEILPVIRIIFATILFFLSTFSNAQPVISFNPQITGLSLPVDIVNAGDGSNRLFIVQQRGVIRVFNVTDSVLLPTPFLDITSLLSTGSEQGLLSMAFYPNYEHPDSAYFFIYYTNLAGQIVLARYQPTTPTSNVANPTGQILLTIPKPFANHNGGKLNFGADNYLYFGTGDGGSGNDPGNNAQNVTSLLGKMLRIDVKNIGSTTYEIPPTNPYFGADPGGVRDEIWALGLRNPWRWSFDRLTQAMFIGDVGQNQYEEINYRSASTTGGVNYGWRCFEGAHVNTAVGACTPTTSPVIGPVYEYTHDPITGGSSIVGGVVYRGTNSDNASMVGYYLFSDTYTSNTWLMNTNVVGFPTIRQPGLQNGISVYGESEAGEIYVASLFSNTVYRVMVISVLPVQLISFSGKTFTGYNDLKWKTGSEQDLSRFIVEYSINGRDWLTAGEVTPLNDPNGHEYLYRHYTTISGKIHYRLRVEQNNGTEIQSAVILLGDNEGPRVKIYPTVVTDGRLQAVSGKPVAHYSIYDSNGGLVVSKDLNNVDGFFQVTLPLIGAGAYWIRIDGKDWTETVRFIVR